MVDKSWPRKFPRTLVSASDDELYGSKVANDNSDSPLAEAGVPGVVCSFNLKSMAAVCSSEADSSRSWIFITNLSAVLKLKRAVSLSRLNLCVVVHLLLGNEAKSVVIWFTKSLEANQRLSPLVRNDLYHFAVKIVDRQQEKFSHCDIIVLIL